MSGVIELSSFEGSVEPRGSPADFIRFRTGGPAEWPVKPNQVEDLAGFSESVPGTELYPFDLIEPASRENSIPATSVPGTEGYAFAFAELACASRENSMSVSSVPGTEGYAVDNEAGGAAE